MTKIPVRISFMSLLDLVRGRRVGFRTWQIYMSGKWIGSACYKLGIELALEEEKDERHQTK